MKWDEDEWGWVTGIYFPYIDCFLMDILLCSRKGIRWSCPVLSWLPLNVPIPILGQLPLSGSINFIYIVKWFNCLAVDLVLEFQTVKLIVWFVAERHRSFSQCAEFYIYFIFPILFIFFFFGHACHLCRSLFPDGLSLTVSLVTYSFICTVYK